MDVAADLDWEASYAFGNRVSLTTGNTSTAWAANYFSIPPLTSNPGVTATTTYAYDNNGNVTEVGTTTFYTYYFDNRLTQSNIWNGTATTTTTYAYDPFGNRISSWIRGHIVHRIKSVRNRHPLDRRLRRHFVELVEDRMRAESRFKVDAKFIQGAPEGWFKPGAGKTEWFQEHEHGPELVVVPADKFSMGSSSSGAHQFSDVWQKCRSRQVR
jgi:YD repeat-containing protein